MRGARESGATLIELVISIVVISIAVSAVLGLLSSSAAHSADSMVLSQAVSIAEAYLEEVSLKPFADPDSVDGEANRVDFDDVDDYDGLVDVGARDQFGNASSVHHFGQQAKAVLDATRPYARIVKITGGVLGSRAIDADGVTKLATLPSREVLLAEVLGAIVAPLSTTAGLFDAPLRDVAGLFLSLIHI